MHALIFARHSLRRAGLALVSALAAALAASVADAPPLAAQAPEARTAIERFRDSLAAASDSAGLLVLERDLIAAAKADRDNALRHLRLGFVSLRLGELGGHAHYDDAASEFQWAIDLKPTWPYSWYGMGIAEYGVGDSQVSFVTGIKTMLGKDALTRSAMAFARSAEVDPSFVQGLVELANTALRQRVNIKLGVALDALRRSAKTPAASDPQVLLARGRVEREVGDVDSALIAFDAYESKAADGALGLLEIARTRFLLGRSDGADPYYRSAASDDSATVGGLRADLAVISTDSVLREFDRQRGAARAAYLRRFWSERDRADLRGPGERLREHYRRLFHARKNFQLATTNRHYDIVERYRSGSRDFDDRGVIYIRHGEPATRATYAAPNLEPNESWRYNRPEGDLIFHFIAREDVQDFKLVESLFDVLGFANAVKLQAEDDGAAGNPIAEQLITSRQQLSPIYSRLENSGRISSGRYQTQERRVGQRSIAVGTTTDSYELRFARDLKVHSDVLAVGRDARGDQVQIAYAIAGSSLEPIPVTRGFLYTVRLRFVAIDVRGRVAASVDTTRHFVAPAAVPPGEHLVGRVAVPLRPGRYQYRLAIQQGEEAGITLPRDTVRVGAPGREALSLSDLVLGARSVNLTWRRSPSDTVRFNPLETFGRKDEMDLYYEVAGLPRGAPYTVELAVRRKGGGGGLFRKIFGGKSAAISLKYEEHAEGTLSASHRSIKLDRLKPGAYVLDLTVSDSTRRRDRRSREFSVVDPSKVQRDRGGQPSYMARPNGEPAGERATGERATGERAEGEKPPPGIDLRAAPAD